jgi:hypothetical protein
VSCMPYTHMQRGGGSRPESSGVVALLAAGAVLAAEQVDGYYMSSTTG